MGALPGGDVEEGSSGRERITEDMWALREAWRDFVSCIEELIESSRARVLAVGASGRASRMLDVASIGLPTSVAIS